MPCTDRPGYEDKMAPYGTPQLLEARRGAGQLRRRLDFCFRRNKKNLEKKKMDSAEEPCSSVKAKYKASNSNHGYYCCVPGCKNRSVNFPSLSFHGFPDASSRSEVRRAWIHAIRRDVGRNFTVTNNTRVCSSHFRQEDYRIPRYAGTSAAPTTSQRLLLPSAVPSIFEWTADPLPKRKAPTERIPPPPSKRRCMRVEVVEVDRDDQKETLTAAQTVKARSVRPFSVVSEDHDYLPVLPGGEPLPVGVLEHIQALQKENFALKEELASAKQKTISLLSVKHDDKDFSACTGLPSYGVFKVLCDHLQPKAEKLQWWRGKATVEKDGEPLRHYTRGLSVEEQFFAVLYRLKSGVSVRIAAKLFGISRSSFSTLFTTWVNFLSCELEEMTAAVTTELPSMGAACFRDFADTRMVIDCTEVFAERPSGLSARQQMFSTYKHHVTIKFLVGISMNGGINFVSCAWGGRTSDKKITCDELLGKLNPGDALMADRGFLIEDELRQRGCKLYMPAFKTANRAQLTAAEVTETRRIARARIHVERAIQRIKTFQILKFVPLSLLHVCEQIFKTCAYLTNFQKPIISELVSLG